jgi:uncharacterized protein involved in outer membrane biogenesis
MSNDAVNEDIHPPRQGRKKLLKWIAAVLGVLLLICVTLLIFKDAVLRKVAEYSVERETGVDASIGGFKLDLGAASVRITDFRLHNPPGFGDGVLLYMPEMFLEVDRQASTNGALRFREARVHLAELNVVRNAQGQTNIMNLQDKLSRKPRKKKTESDDLKFTGIGELHVSVGAVRYEDMQDPTLNQAFNIGISNEVVTTIKSEKDLEEWATAFLIRVVIQQALLKSRNQPSLLDMLRPPPGTNR